MNKTQEALKLAQDLRALADRFSEGWHEGIKIDASDIVLLSDAAEALAEQPAQQQEPVAKDAEEWGGRLNQASWAAIEAWDAELMGPMPVSVFNNIKGVVRAAILEYVKGYTSPQPSKPWVGLTDEELHGVIRAGEYDSMEEFARAIEAAHGIKEGA